MGYLALVLAVHFPLRHLPLQANHKLHPQLLVILPPVRLLQPHRRLRRAMGYLALALAVHFLLRHLPLQAKQLRPRLLVIPPSLRLLLPQRHLAMDHLVLALVVHFPQPLLQRQAL